MFDWSEYLDFAKKLKCCDDNGDIIEAACRASISRAYYAAFCLSRNYLRDNGDYTLRSAYNGDPFAIRQIESVHKYVITEYKNSDNEDKVNIGLVLENLKNRRVYADYRDNPRHDLKTFVEESLVYSETILEDLKKLSK